MLDKREGWERGRRKGGEGGKEGRKEGRKSKAKQAIRVLMCFCTQSAMRLTRS